MSEEWNIIPGWHWVTQVYNSTAPGIPLRKICRDYYVNESKDGELEGFEEGMLPFQFVKDVLLELDRLASNKARRDGQSKVARIRREKCYYHQHDDEHPECP